jgi:hypothetical protein
LNQDPFFTAPNCLAWSRHVPSDRSQSLRLGWLLLAGWLLLWPAVEACRQEWPMLVERAAPERTAAGGCGRAAGSGDQGGCCRGRSEAPARPATCPEGSNSARCNQCFGAGGPLLFAHALTVPEPERVVLGAILLGDHVVASRDLRPPVPPPRAEAPIPI